MRHLRKQHSPSSDSLQDINEYVVRGMVGRITHMSEMAFSLLLIETTDRGIPLSHPPFGAVGNSALLTFGRFSEPNRGHGPGYTSMANVRFRLSSTVGKKIISDFSVKLKVTFKCLKALKMSRKTLKELKMCT